MCACQRTRRIFEALSFTYMYVCLKLGVTIPIPGAEAQWSLQTMEILRSRFVSDYDFPHDSTFDSFLARARSFNCSFCDILTDRACCLHNNKLAPILAAVIRGSQPATAQCMGEFSRQYFRIILFFLNKRTFLVLLTYDI